MKKKGYILLAIPILVEMSFTVWQHLHIPSPHADAPQAEGVCALKTVSSVPYLAKYVISHYFRALDEKPPSLSGVPQTDPDQTTFFSVPFRHRNMYCCLVAEDTLTLYADRNGNNDLLDEKPLSPRRQKIVDNVFLNVFGPLSLADDASTAPFYLYLPDDSAAIHRAPVTLSTGKIRIGESLCDVILADLDFDNRYITRFTPACRGPEAPWIDGLCDRLLIDLDSDGLFANRSFEQMERMPLCSLIRFQDGFYAIDIVADTLTAAPVTPPTGTLKLNTESSSLMLYSDTWCGFVNSSSTVELPAGRYTVAYAQNTFKDSRGDLWTCRSKSQSGAAPAFAISRGFPTRFCFPLAFRIQTDVAWGQEACQIDVELIDDTGTAYIPQIRKNHENTENPKISIVDGKGAVLHTGTMEYG